MYLVISEKPSVAQSIAKVLGAYKKEDGYLEGRECIVSWCLGHLAEYAMPEAYDEKYQKWVFSDLPIIPAVWKLAVDPAKKSQFSVLKKLLNRSDLAYVVNACDAGREGELIFKRVYDLSGSKLPVKRLWISSMEDTAIQDGFANLKSGEEYRSLADASVCRAQADWLVGMNATRAFTKTYDYRLTVGRVQSPTLAMLVKRSEEIQSFQKKQYFQAHILSDGMDAVSENLNDRPDADRLAADCRGQDATVTEIKHEQKSVAPPKLYDLTTLQREANRLFGLTAKQTLETAQSLYEKKLLTYPRTDSQFLTDDMGETARKVIQEILAVLPFAPVEHVEPQIDRVLNSKKVSDHHAIIPTMELAKADLDKLSETERKILFLAANRLLCATADKHRFTSVKATITCNGHLFTASGKTITASGWKQYDDALKAYFRADREESEESDGGSLPELHQGQILKQVQTKVTEHWTQPPKAYTEDSLLAAMERAGNTEMDDEVERKGLGTPATRASIIEKLLASKYAVRKKKQIVPTEAGTKMIALLPDYLKSAQMTADWENRLLLMERGETTVESFMQDIYTLIERILVSCREVPPDVKARFSTSENETNSEIGKCPLCGKPVHEGKSNFYCSDRNCSFVLWKENRYLTGMKKTVNTKMASDLLAKGRTHCKDFYSAKTGKDFSADLLLEVSEDGKTKFKMEFPQKKTTK